jgi:hypothetical protein
MADFGEGGLEEGLGAEHSNRGSVSICDEAPWWKEACGDGSNGGVLATRNDAVRAEEGV